MEGLSNYPEGEVVADEEGDGCSGCWSGEVAEEPSHRVVGVGELEPREADCIDQE